MAQKNIDFGTFPNDPDADAIRTAFQKTQENFTELFAGLQDQAVLSVNKTPGAGITVFPITGNVVVSANIACVTVTSSTLSVGINGNGNSIAILDNSSTQQIVIDLPSNISGVNNASFTGTVTASAFVSNTSITSANTITSTGNITGGNLTTAGVLTVTGNANVGNVGASNGVFTANITASNIYANSGTIGATTGNFSGNISANNANITNNVNANIITANFFSGDGSNLTNVVSAPGNIILNANSNVSIPSANGSVLVSVAGTSNVMIVTQTGANIAGTANVTGNANVGNLGAAAGIFTSNVTAGNVYANSGTVGASLLTGTLTTAAQPNITSVGTLTSLTVTGNTTAGNLVGPLANGNSNISITSNANITMYVAGNATARMTLTSTGANIAGTANVSGNANVGNLGATSGVFTGNVTAGNANVTGQLISTVATGTAPLVVTSTTQVANLNAATAGEATNAAAVQTNASTSTTVYPTFVSASTNANYALNTVSGISANLANNAITATTFVGSLSGLASSATNANAVLSNSSTNTTVYLAGTSTSANGNVGLEKVTGIYANMGNNAITATTFVGALSGAATTAGTVTTNAQPNITSVGTLTSLGVSGNVTGANFIGNLANGNSDINIPAANGNINFDVAGNANILVVTGTGANIAGTLNATGNANVGNLGATGVVATTLGGSLTTNAQPNITSVGTLASLGVTGKVTAGQLQGDGGNISNVQGGNVSGAVASATAATNASALLQNTSTATTVYPTFTTSSANGNSQAVINTSISANLGNASITATTFVGALSGAATSATTAGTVTTAAQPNITSVGTLSSLAVTANVTAGNVYANSGTIGASLLTGTLTTAAQPNVTSVGTLTSLSVTGNITAGNLIGPLANGNSNVNIPAANGNVNITAVGNTTLVVTGTGANIAGTANITGNANVANLGTGRVIATGNISGTQLISNIATGTAPLVVTSTTQVANLNAATAGEATNAAAVLSNSSTNTTVYLAGTSTSANGNVGLEKVTGIYANMGNNAITATTFVGALSGAATTAGTVTTNAQPNITSVGTLSSLSITGNVSAGNANLGNFVTANFFSGDGSQLTNISVGAGSYIENGNSEVRVDANSSVRFSVAGNANVMTVTGTGANITGTANITGNLSAGNISATLFTGTIATASNAQPNITSLGTLTALNVNGVANLGAVGNVRISGGSNNQVLVATGTGSNVAFVTATGLTIAPGSNTQVLFNDAGSFAANANMTFDKTTGTLSAYGLAITNSGTFGNVYANSGTVRGSLLTGTLTTAAQPNITSVGTLTSLIVNGNIGAGNISGGNLVSANFISGNGNALFSIQGANVTGTVPSANSATNAAALLQNTSTATTVYPTFTTSGANGNSSAVINTGISANLGNASITATTFIGTLSGNATTAGTVTTNAQPNITSVGTLTGLTVNGNAGLGRTTVNPGAATSNIHALTVLQTWNNSSVQFSALEANITDTASAANSLLLDLQVASASKFAVSKEGNIFYSGVITGNGSGLSAIAGANVTDTVGAATNATAVLTNTSTATTVYLAGTSTAVNAHASLEKVTGIYANMSNNSITATTFVGSLSGTATSATTATTAGTVTTNAQPNITSVGTLTGLTLASNTTFSPQIVSTNFTNDAFGPYWNTRKSRANAIVQTGDDLGTFMFQGYDGNAYVNSSYLTAEVDGAPTANSGFVPSKLGFYTSNTTALSAKLTIFGNGLASFSGALSATGNANVGNLGTAQVLSSANVTAPQIISNVATGTAPFVVTSTTRVSNLNVANAGFADSAGNVTNSVTFNNGGTGDVSGTTYNGGAAKTVSYNTVGASPLAGSSSLTTTGTVTSGTWNSTFTAGLNANTLANIQGANVSGAVASATNAAAVLNNVRTSGTYYPAFISATANGNYALNSNTAIYANLNTGTLYATAHDGNLYVSDTNSVTTVIKTGVETAYFGNTAATSGLVTFERFRGNVTTYTEVLNGDRLGQINYLAWDSLQPVEVANITTIVDATYTAGTQSPPAAITFATGNVSSNGSPPERMRIASTGNVGIANTNPAHTLSITGTLNVSANANVGNIGATNANITAMTATGNVSAGNVSVTGYHLRSVGTAISAAGSTQGTATAITKEMNVVSTVASGAGVVLPTAVAGMVISITNTSANSLAVYPAVNGIINSQAANAAYSQPAGATLQFIAPTITQWYTVGATFA